MLKCRDIQLQIRETGNYTGRLPRVTWCRHCHGWYLCNRPWWKILR